MSFEALADAEYAHNVGMDNAARPWILSDRDVWYRNPFYTGPAVPHPEDDIYTAEDLFFFNANWAVSNNKCRDEAIVAKEKARIDAIAAARYDDEIPF